MGGGIMRVVDQIVAEIMDLDARGQGGSTEV